MYDQRQKQDVSSLALWPVDRIRRSRGFSLDRGERHSVILANTNLQQCETVKNTINHNKKREELYRETNTTREILTLME